jgi:hypothetical protein
MDVQIRGSEVARAVSLAIRGSLAVRRLIPARPVQAAVQTVARIVAAPLVRRATLPNVVTPTKFHPTAAALPGGSTLLGLINGLAGWAVLLALAGLVIGAALWAIGSHSQNYQQSYVGRRAVLVSGIAALLIGAAPTLIDFFFSTGHQIVNPLS